MSLRFLSLFLLATALGSAGCPPPTPTISPAPGIAESTVSATLPALDILAWNLNSGISDDTDGDINQAIALMAATDLAGIYAFSEVNPSWETPLATALDARGNFGLRISQSGRNQRLALAWDEARFEAVEVNELGRVNADGHGRAPLAALLQDRSTGARFMVIAVHLRSGSAEARAEESAILRDLIGELEYPTVVVGDFNYRCPSDGTAPADCDPAFDIFVQGGQMQWIAPENPSPSMCRSRYTTMLDMVFVAGATPATSVVRMLPTDWCDGMGDGAHTPISAELRWAPLNAP
jgi:endonuclease/exonuclease/phosphatase family metal-dependent hydrolase